MPGVDGRHALYVLLRAKLTFAQGSGFTQGAGNGHELGYSITSSAREIRTAETVSPSCLAVRALMTN
jgi:hypothetical protein